jgi:hypothetical protein
VEYQEGLGYNWKNKDQEDFSEEVTFKLPYRIMRRNQPGNWVMYIEKGAGIEEEQGDPILHLRNQGKYPCKVPLPSIFPQFPFLVTGLSGMFPEILSTRSQVCQAE